MKNYYNMLKILGTSLRIANTLYTQQKMLHKINYCISFWSQKSYTFRILDIYELVLSVLHFFDKVIQN